jgi:hypothetical protein
VLESEIQRVLEIVKELAIEIQRVSVIVKEWAIEIQRRLVIVIQWPLVSGTPFAMEMAMVTAWQADIAQYLA